LQFYILEKNAIKNSELDLLRELIYNIHDKTRGDKMSIRVFEAFAGIGAPRKALINIGVDFKVKYTSEINNDAINAYTKLYGENNNLGDISKIDEKCLDDFDLFVAGFPCQDISHNGKQLGMIEGTRSGLVWEALRIIEHKKPQYVVFENVRNLLNYKFKNDFDKIISKLKSIGYNVDFKLLNAKNFGICQNRERVFIVGSLLNKFNIPDRSLRPLITLHDVLVDDDCDNIKSDIKKRIMSESINLNVRNAIPEEKSKVKNKVQCLNSKNIYNKQPSQQYRVYSKNGLMTTLSAQLNGRYNIISSKGFIRKITPKESLLLQCFDIEDYEKMKDMDAKLYKLSGNSIPVYMLEEIFRELFKNDKRINIRQYKGAQI
jgi:DNA (cytosine-5)-methyltransferase 1